MEKYIAVLLVITVFFCGFVCMCLAIHHTLRMFSEVRNSKNYFVQLLPWAAFVCSSTLSEKGREHRTKMMISLGVALLCAASLAVFHALIKPG